MDVQVDLRIVGNLLGFYALSKLDTEGIWYGKWHVDPLYFRSN